MTPGAHAPGLIPARDEDRGDVEPGAGHEMAGRRLVARGQAYHPIELRSLDHDLDVVHDQVPRRHQIARLFSGAGDEVAGCRGAYLERKAARLPNRLLDDLRDPVEVDVAD